MFTITSIKESEGATREITIRFSNGKQVQIYGAGTYGSQPTAFVQHGYDGLTDEQTRAYGFTLPIAEYYAKWLNGGQRPAPMQNVPTCSTSADASESEVAEVEERDHYQYNGDEHWPTYHEARYGL